jgi:hypothetical protein
VDSLLKDYAHFLTDYTPEIKQFAIDVALKESRYIFTRRLGKKQYGYCTHCRKEYQTDKFNHNTVRICPECLSGCVVKASGLGRSSLVDEAYFVYYEKSAIDPQAIVAKGIYVVRDYRGDYMKVKTHYQTIAFYLFKMGYQRFF